jgi:dipeptidyl aminopeptidase/acylaminoacyl peptidase
MHCSSGPAGASPSSTSTNAGPAATGGPTPPPTTAPGESATSTTAAPPPPPTGYGRAYRQRLQGTWGIVDVDDCCAAAQALVDRGLADPRRLAIRGGSAGGFTTLAALTFRDRFRAGASHYGVADLAALARETHKFESRYLDGLVGPWPEAEAVYRRRSPIHHTDGLSCPIILLQGLEDEIVPPAQAEVMVEALRAKGLPHAYLTFEGEQHGFRRASSIVRALEAELYFYGRVFGFELADPVDPIDIAFEDRLAAAAQPERAG